LLGATSRPTVRFPPALTLLGPALVAGVAYVDPGNVATNSVAGATYGYDLVWVVIAANASAVVVQYLSAKLGVVTGRTLPELCRAEFTAGTVRGLWLQAQVVACATELAEVVGGAVALQLLFGVPRAVGAVIIGVCGMGLLATGTGTRRGFELVVAALMAMIAAAFLGSAWQANPDVPAVLAGAVPAQVTGGGLLLVTGMLGATVMPHAIYLHSALAAERTRSVSGVGTKRMLRVNLGSVLVSMLVAGSANVAMLVLAAAGASGVTHGGLAEMRSALQSTAGPVVSIVFVVSLLLSGLASSSVGALAGGVILDGFVGKKWPVAAGRAVNLAPAIVLLATPIDTTQILVWSQVVLSFGIPFALVPLLRFTSDRRIMGALANRNAVTWVAAAVTAAIVALNGLLVVGTLGL
jgi:manganese transport protein